MPSIDVSSIRIAENEADQRDSLRKVSHGNMSFKIGEFCDLQEIGSGFNGTVYRSLHRPTGLIVARKVLPSIFLHRAKAQQARRRKLVLGECHLSEVQLAQQCHSPWIVTCYGIDIGPTEISIAMELMDLGSLADLSGRIGGEFPLPVLAHIAKSVMLGLMHLHANHQILHRDLKPSNILANRKGEIKLADFGEAIRLVSSSSARSIVGTMAYMAPERIRGSPYSIKSEVWSLGVTLVELATGRTLASESGWSSIVTDPNDLVEMAAAELWESILTQVPAGIDWIYQHRSPVLGDFVRACLVHEVSKRASLEELLEHPLGECENGDVTEWFQSKNSI